MRFFRILLATVVALATAASFAYAKTDDDVYIYKGNPASQENITLGGWGSGKAADSTEKVLTGSNSVKITTQSMYSGGRLDFASPVTLYSGGIDKNRYLVFTFFFSETQTVNPAAGTMSAYDVDPYIMPRANKVRFVFYGEDDKVFATEENTQQLDPDDNWVRISVPLSKFKAISDKEFKMTRLVIGTDVSSTVYLGEIKISSDDTPISVDDINIASGSAVAIGDDVFVVGSAKGGLSALVYSWDFDKSNGIQSEQTGMIADRRYFKEGDYTITLTVSDEAGLKKPVSVSNTISVN